jgi:putative SOS response-associated peptidase YedK
MCGRYVIFTSEEYKEMQAILREIAKHFKTGIGVMKTGEIFPSYTVPAIGYPGGRYDYTLLEWGIKFDTGKSIINARSETIEEKKLFSRLLPSGRCLLPANGFYEWNSKVKYLIQPEELNTFYFAGLQDRNNRFVIITAESVNDMKDIHDRMPVILDKDMGEKWLKEKDTSILTPYFGRLSIKKAV